MYELEATADVLLMSSHIKPSIDQQNLAVATETPEAVLVWAVLEGNRDEYGRLYHLYAPLVHGVLLTRAQQSGGEAVKVKRAKDYSGAREDHRQLNRAV
jgi:hypothetical protein